MFLGATPLAFNSNARRAAGLIEQASAAASSATS